VSKAGAPTTPGGVGVFASNNETPAHSDVVVRTQILWANAPSQSLAHKQDQITIDKSMQAAMDM